MLFFTSSALSSSFNIDDSVSHRLILDEVANQINQVNSNGEGYSKKINLPSDKGYYELTINKNKLIIEYDGKKGETLLPLVNIDSKDKLISGRSYLITKTDEGIVIS
ncbi:hypothetical protein [Methanobrevibacter sp.]|uniref:hypothetical protein n=1 Tax=Methanobrevibacter sp. TaxID=66852 RepID=UPI0025E3E673|nr:hypothetical protein [Methanobrevibacter sp.]